MLSYQTESGALKCYFWRGDFKTHDAVIKLSLILSSYKLYLQNYVTECKYKHMVLKNIMNSWGSYDGDQNAHTLIVAICAYTILLDIIVSPDEVMVSTTVEGAPIAGQNYSLTCTLQLPEGISTPALLQWLDSNGPITNGSGTTVGEPRLAGTTTDITLEFSPLRVSHNGHFTCKATITSPALPYRIVKSAELDVFVQGE